MRFPPLHTTERDIAALRLRLESQVTGHVLVNANQLTIAQLVAHFMTHATDTYASRRGTTEIQNYADAFRLLLLLYSDLPVLEFGILHFKAIRQLMIESGLCRETINRQRTRRIKTLFRWATEHHQLDSRIIARLESVKPLKPGMAGVIESSPIPPTSIEQIVAVLLDDQCPKVVRDMLQFQKLTDTRPGEVCHCQGHEIDTTRSPWLWSPRLHKNAHRGGGGGSGGGSNHRRTIYIGPAAQLVILPYLNDGFLFLTPPWRGCGGRPYRVDHYQKSIVASCRRVKVQRFSPQSVRRMAATEADEHADIETAMELLGHRDVRTTERYLSRGGRRAKKYVQERG